MISLDDLSFVLGVEAKDVETWIMSDEPLTDGVPDDDVFDVAVALVLDDAFGFTRTTIAMASFNPLADYIEVPIGCTKARVDLRPIRSAVAPLVRQAA